MTKFNNFMSQKVVLKLISQIYSERLHITKQEGTSRDLDMASFAYQYFINSFGINKLADQKFLILALSVRRYSSNLRINMFSRFLGLNDDFTNYSTDELNKYMEVYDYVLNVSQAGQIAPNQEGEVKFCVP